MRRVGSVFGALAGRSCIALRDFRGWSTLARMGTKAASFAFLELAPRKRATGYASGPCASCGKRVEVTLPHALVRHPNPALGDALAHVGVLHEPCVEKYRAHALAGGLSSIAERA